MFNRKGFWRTKQAIGSDTAPQVAHPDASASLEPLGGPHGSNVHGFDSEVENWNFSLATAKHMEELAQDVARHAASRP
eukprot:5220072-Amphidinium_carterae.1